MVKIKLSRLGKRNDPVYRIVAIDSQKKLGGKQLEILGFWNPREDQKKLDKKSYEKWIKQGAQPSDTVRKLFSQ